MDESDAKGEFERLGAKQFVSNYVIDGTPFVFEGDREKYLNWRALAADMLAIDPGNVFVVGSAAVGCSLNPSKGFSAFSDASDIDVAIVSTLKFDIAWDEIRRLRKFKVQNQEQAAAVKMHKERLIFEGCIATERFLGLLSFGQKWSRISLSLSRTPEMNGREVNFRIYRDIGSLRFYHESNVERLFS